MIAIDLPGFGDSPQLERLRGLDDLVLVLAEFLDALGINDVHLIGHSIGGWAAAEFASFYPERVRSLTLITPLGLRVEGDTPVDLFRRTAESRLELFVGDRVEELFPTGDADAQEEQLVLDYLDLTGFGRLAWNPRYDWKLEHRLGRFTKPALVIGAADDRILPASHLAAYAELLTGSRTAVIAGTHGRAADHGIVAQEPESLAAEITTFIGAN